MFSNMKIETRLLAGFGLLVLLLIVVTAVGTYRLQELDDETQVMVTDLYPKTELVTRRWPG